MNGNLTMSHAAENHGRIASDLRRNGARHGALSQRGAEWAGQSRGFVMLYRVYSGPKGSEEVSPLEKEHLLFKEFVTLDEALGWAQHVETGGRVPLLIEGDDGTKMNKRAIADALHTRISV